jgi:hypothetical protein
MCGIVGVHSGDKFGFYGKDRDALKGMMVVNSLRGIHSTGLMGFHKEESMKDQVNIVKTVGSPYYLFDWNKSDEFFNRMVSNFGTVVGHGRYATRGAVNADNAHPFEENHIVLVHNGGITNFYSLHDKNKHEHIQVDSHLVARLIADEGADEILPRLQGAYTLVWYDTTDGTLHMARNDQRPLFMGNNDKNMFFASEDHTVAWANGRYDLKIGEIKSLPTYQHYTFPKGSLEPEIKEYKQKYVYTPPVKRYNGTEMDDEWYENRKSRRQYYNNLPATDNSGAGISLGDEISFVVEDYRNMFAGGDEKLILGYNDAFPNVEFAVSSGLYKDEELIGATRMVGKVHRIHPLAAGIALRQGIRFRAFLHDHDLEHGRPSLGYMGENKMWLQIRDAIDENAAYSMADYRYQQIAKQGCGWCTCDITPKELANPENLAVWTGTKNEQFLLCPTCATGYCGEQKKTH